MNNSINLHETKSKSGNNPIAHGNAVGILRILSEALSVPLPSASRPSGTHSVPDGREAEGRGTDNAGNQ